MPSWELFEQQDQAYWDSVLPPQVTARVAVEQASVIGWDRYVGRFGAKIGMHTFGSSAPLKDLQTKFGFTPDKVLAAAKEQIARAREAEGMNPLRSLQEYGQAVWLDFVARRFLADGGLKRLVDEDGLRGRHLQPVDLRKGDRAQRRLRRLARRRPKRTATSTCEALYERLAVEDIQQRRRHSAPGL